MNKKMIEESAGVAGTVLGASVVGGIFALGVSYLFYAMTVEYVRIVAQIFSVTRI